MANIRYLAVIAAVGLAMSTTGAAKADAVQKVVQLHTVMILKGVTVPPVVADYFFADLASCNDQLQRLGRRNISGIEGVEFIAACMENVLKTQL